MSHCRDEHGGHDHHGHGHGHGHGHDHDHEHDHSDDITPALQHSLYEHVQFDKIVTMNETETDSGKAIVKKTWAERLQPAPELASHADEQLLMNVP
jgi:RNA polymerase I-specific transcription initiation factor RRN6